MGDDLHDGYVEGGRRLGPLAPRRRGPLGAAPGGAHPCRAGQARLGGGRPFGPGLRPTGASGLLGGQFLDVRRTWTRRGRNSQGALKIEIALAPEICDGLVPGANAEGAPRSRGLVGISRFGGARRARPENLFRAGGGVGDLITTCTPKTLGQSRGRRSDRSWPKPRGESG